MYRVVTIFPDTHRNSLLQNNSKRSGVSYQFPIRRMVELASGTEPAETSPEIIRTVWLTRSFGVRVSCGTSIHNRSRATATCHAQLLPNGT